MVETASVLSVVCLLQVVFFYVCRDQYIIVLLAFSPGNFPLLLICLNYGYSVDCSTVDLQ
jgi:hypothetical protein